MSCKQCIHYEVCVKELNDNVEFFTDTDVNDCICFKNKKFYEDTTKLKSIDYLNRFKKLYCSSNKCKIVYLLMVNTAK